TGGSGWTRAYGCEGRIALQRIHCNEFVADQAKLDIETLGPRALAPLETSALEVLDGHPVHDELFGDRHPEGCQATVGLPVVFESGTEVVLGLREIPTVGFGRGRLSFCADRRSANTRDGRAEQRDREDRRE